MLCQTLTVEMSRKKTKKHKKERKKSSMCSWEDQRKGDTQTPGSSRSKNKHEHFPSHVGHKQKWVKGTRSPRSPREERSKKETWKKSEVENKQLKLTGNKASLDSDHRAPRDPVKHLSLGHDVHAMGKSSQTSSRPGPETKELEGRRKSLVKRRSAQEEPRQKPAKACILPGGEKRKEVLKRRSSTQEDYPVVKQRTTESQVAVREKLSHNRKELEMRRSRDLGREVHSKAQHISSIKTGAVHSKESLSSVRNPAWSLTPKLPQNVSPEMQGSERQKGQAGSTHGPTSGGEPTSYTRLPVTFKISKKHCAVKANTDVCIIDSDDKMTAVAGCVASPSAKTGPGHIGPRPAKVASPVGSAPRQSSRFHQARVVQHGPVTDRSATITSSTTEWTEHALHQGASTECTEAFHIDQEMLLVEELHLARFDRRLTVNVAESYGELTCMDVDLPEEGAKMALSEELQDLLIVLDTNVLLSHLDFVKKMRSHGLGALGHPTLLVPWVVLQELDALKSGKLSSKVECKARPAVQYIYNCLKRQEPRLRGQSLQQASQAACGLLVGNNDDRVLQCCLQYQALRPEGSLILCTNDKNLCSKALLSGVKALSKADLVEQAEVNPGLLNHSCSLHAVQPPAGPNEEGLLHKGEEANGLQAPGVEGELSVCVSALESSLQGALSAVLVEEMKGAFGDLWTEIVYLKPPWTLQAVLQCFRKHWIAVFGNIIKRNLLSCVEMLSTSLCSGVMVERKTVLMSARAAEELLVALSCRSSYGGHVNAALFHLRGLKGRPQTQPLKIPVEDPSDDETLMSEAVEDTAPPPQASHQEVWALFESIWNNVCQVSSAVFSALHCPTGSVGLTQSGPMPPPQDALSCLHRLSATLAQLLEHFHRLVSVDSTVEDAQALLTLIHTCEMAVMEPCVSAWDLFECLSLQEYREKLCVGGTQLMELKAKLDQCAAAVCGQDGGST
ncbi:transcriptional protein SWT1 [Electrophorus electricus]|uniref:transcriptional protein SWT1 n=1 Tax=Electrophorus electricus TaxID=8005 RepID=UPI0015D0A3F2|nr:transcriptional protein SWT1 [Electrophorus electricus]